ncbi:MAG TPA: hypothetical protein VH301_09600 [Usitatibacter sp.]|nr:hypothetical protein [Usitatibacter sp.]
MALHHARENKKMQNYYEMLGVPHDATPAVAKIAYDGKLKALARAGLPEAERQREERDLNKAYVTLSTPVKKDWYDNQWALHTERREKAARSSQRSTWIGAGVVASILVVGLAYVLVHRANERERVRLEESRIALEQEKARKKSVIEEARLQLQQDSEAYRQEMGQRLQAQREQAYRDQQSRISSDRAFQQQVQGRALNTFDERSTQFNADRQRAIEYEDKRRAEDDRRKALAEVERQKRFVAEREREDERIRAERAYRVQREQELAKAREAAAARRAAGQ